MSDPMMQHMTIERFINMSAVILSELEGQTAFGHGNLSKDHMREINALETALCDLAEIYGTDSVFSRDPLPLSWYFKTEEEATALYNAEIEFQNGGFNDNDVFVAVEGCTGCDNCDGVCNPS
jgi:hypothetical protein